MSCKQPKHYRNLDTNERLAQAIQNKNFNEAAVAQGLLEVAKKMENSMHQTQQEKRKKRLLKGYFKHVSAKKRKDSH